MIERAPIITNEKITAWHKKQVPWMYTGNDEEWCEERLHSLITQSETGDTQALLEAQCDADHTYYMRWFAEWLEKNKSYFLGNFRAGDNYGNLIEALLKEAGELKDGNNIPEG